MPTSLYKEIQRRGPADMATCNKCAGMWKLSIRGPSTHVLGPHRGVVQGPHRGVVQAPIGVWYSAPTECYRAFGVW